MRAGITATAALRWANSWSCWGLRCRNVLKPAPKPQKKEFEKRGDMLDDIKVDPKHPPHMPPPTWTANLPGIHGDQGPEQAEDAAATELD